MTLRVATWQDLVPAARVFAAAFKDAGLFGAFMHPHRNEFPDDMSLFFLRELRLNYYAGADHRVIVTYTTEAGKESITGAAHWIRKRAQERIPGLYNRIMTSSTKAYNYLESFVYPNRAADPSTFNVLERMDPFTKHHWTGTRAEGWYLSLIGVDPNAGGRGYGRQMVKYGFDQAREEGVGCSVIAAPGRASFYRACGYNVDVGTTSDEGGDDNPLRNFETATIHFWDNGIEPVGIKKYGEK